MEMMSGEITMTRTFRCFRIAIGIACAGLIARASTPASAAEFPTRPVRFVVASTPGGALDVLSRLVGPKLTEKWGQPIVIDNRAGAGGIIGTEIVAIPYKGAGAATVAVVSGQVQMLFTSTGAAMPHIKASRIKALGVTTAKRTPALPDVPTIAETGLPGFQVDGWYAVMAPGKTPKQIVDKLYHDIAAVLKMPDVASRIESVGLEPGGISPQQFAEYIRAELKKWGTLIKDAGISAE